MRGAHEEYIEAQAEAHYAASDAQAREIGHLIEALEATGKWWMIGKGMAKPNEPLYGCVIQEPEIDGRTLAKVEGNSLEFCAIEALERLRRD